MAGVLCNFSMNSNVGPPPDCGGKKTGQVIESCTFGGSRLRGPHELVLVGGHETTVAVRLF